MTLLLENGWTDAQSWGVFGEGEGDSVGVGEGVGVGVVLGVGVGLGSGVGLALGDGLVAVGLGSVAVGVGVAVALGVALGLALADGLGVAEAAMTAALFASVVPALAIAAGRLAHTLVVLVRLAAEACTAVAPTEPLDTSISPATTANEARPTVNVIVVTPSSRCRPQRRRRSCVP